MSGKKLKHAVNSTGNPEDPKRRMIERITGMATLVILCIFPLVYHDFYFDILKTKYQFYYMTILLMMLALLAVSGYAAITRPVSGRTRQSLHSFVKKLTVPEWAMLSFLFVATCSTIFSEYRFEAFWGNEGRYTGLFLLLIYGLAFFAISRGLRFKSWYLDAFLAASMLVCLLGITDYFQLDLLHFKANMKPEQLNMFLSTLGNINTYTAYVALVLAISATLFATSRKWGYTIWYAVCMVISFFAIIMGNSDNAYLALAALFAFLPLYLFRTRGGITRYIIMGATFLTVVFCISRINAAMGDRVLGIDSLFSFIARFSGLLYVVIGLWILIMGLVAWEYRAKRKNDKTSQTGKVSQAEKTSQTGKVSQAEKRGKRTLLPVYIWMGILVLAALLLAAVLWDANIGGHAERYGSLSSYLIFNDNWGTNRGAIWRLGLESYRDFPWLQKLFGYGPDTFGIIMVNEHYQEMTDLYREIFDSAHNEYLQYFITIGPLGLLSYLTLLISSGIRMVKRAGQNPYAMAILFALICYGVQAFVNINLPIATPVMWTLLMMGLAESREIETKGSVEEV